MAAVIAVTLFRHRRVELWSFLGGVGKSVHELKMASVPKYRTHRSSNKSPPATDDVTTVLIKMIDL